MALTMLEILDETIDYYSKDTRRRSSGIYNSTADRHCAVGRCFNQRYSQLGQNLPGNGTDILELIVCNEEESLDDFFLPEYQGHSLLFWRDLQNLHDLDIYWNKEGLSGLGQVKSNWIKNQILTNKY